MNYMGKRVISLCPERDKVFARGHREFMIRVGREEFCDKIILLVRGVILLAALIGLAIFLIFSKN